MAWKSNIFATIAVFFVANFAKTDGIHLQCTYNVVSFETVGDIYTCIGNVALDGNANVTAVTGTHQTGRGHGDVQGIISLFQNLPFFPTNLEHFFPNIIAINLHHNSITAISNKHLIPFPNLRFLSLWYNDITSLDGDLFSGINLLGWIDFDENSITNVGHDLNLPSGSIVNFQRNVCIHEYASTPEQIAALKLNLLRYCPPTIAQIEDSLKKRQNVFTYVAGQIESLIETMDELNNGIEFLRNDQAIIGNVVDGLIGRVTELERIIIGRELKADPGA